MLNLRKSNVAPTATPRMGQWPDPQGVIALPVADLPARLEGLNLEAAILAAPASGRRGAIAGQRDDDDQDDEDRDPDGDQPHDPDEDDDDDEEDDDDDDYDDDDDEEEVETDDAHPGYPARRSLTGHPRAGRL